MLYIISTPIGNLGDITLRALEAIKSCDILVCEDTRITQKLLNHFNIKIPKMISYANHNFKNMTNRIIKLLKEKLKVGLISDAGTPLISDPGELLVKACYDNNIEVVNIPGACSLISALVVSGLDTKEFFFGGFLSAKQSIRLNQLEKVEKFKCTLIFFETKHRILKTLNDIISIFGKEQQIVIVRELTKVYEEIIRGSVLYVFHKIKEKGILGELILLIDKKNNKDIIISKDELDQVIKDKLKTHSLKDVTNIIANKYKLNKKGIYNMALSIKNEK